MMRDEVRAEGGTACVGSGASSMHEEGPTQGCGGQGTRGAHVEHVDHTCRVSYGLGGSK